MTRHADVSAEHVNWIIESLFQLPRGAVWLENAPYAQAHSRCMELNMADPKHQHLKGRAVPQSKGMAGIYRLPKGGDAP